MMLENQDTWITRTLSVGLKVSTIHRFHCIQFAYFTAVLLTIYVSICSLNINQVNSFYNLPCTAAAGIISVIPLKESGTQGRTQDFLKGVSIGCKSKMWGSSR